MRRDQQIRRFVDELWDWYARHKRALPWRDLSDRSRDIRAYKILVSEIMLQQTQVSRVIGAYKKFLAHFPTAKDLAEASNRDVILVWQGMGYNSRALRLRDAARVVVKNMNSTFPCELDALMKIPGIGRYTAGAIRTFAFDLPTACVDTNIRRVLHRVFAGPERADGTWQKDDTWITDVCAHVLDAWLAAGHPGRDFLAALMDFGSLVQTKRNPKWDICPMTKAGIMKTTRRNLPKSESRIPKSEPGRVIAGRFVPNRIIRGRIVQELRESPRGCTLQELGSRVCIDWNPHEHTAWMDGLLSALTRDMLLRKRALRYVLAD